MSPFNATFRFSGTAFVPAPKVNAAVVRLVPLKKPRLTADFEIISKVVKAVFQFKNKRWIVGLK